MKFFIFNDTRYDFHFGCRLTINSLLDGLRNRNGIILGTSPAGYDWKVDDRVRKKIQESDVIIVNGEGTFHHNQKEAHALADVASFCKAIHKPCYLINTVYCENDKDLAEKVKDFKKIFVRDGMSQDVLGAHGIKSKVVPDLIFKNSLRKFSSQKKGYLITDAVSHPEILIDSNQKLFDLSRQIKSSYLPLSSHQLPIDIFSLSQIISFFTYMISTALFLIIGLFRKIPLSKRQRLYFAVSESSYWKKIAASESVLTGRYHGVCTAIIARTPFFTLKSNSHKVESLLNDVGLGNKRLINHEDLNNLSGLILLLSKKQKFFL